MSRFFHFVVRYLGFLKQVPLFPLFFEVIISTWTVIFHKEINDAIESVEKYLSKREGIDITLHKYGGVQFNYCGHELGHIHGNGLTDIRLNRKVKAELIRSGTAREHHVFKNSGWISFHISKSEDVTIVLGIFETALSLRKQKMGLVD